MMGPGTSEGPGAVGQPLFATTHWSVVLAAADEERPEAAAALNQLCRAYWYPLYAYVRRRGYTPEDAQDLTQDFFALFLSRKSFSLADPSRGRFRSFLLTSLQHFLADEWRRAHRAKRGGGAPELPLDGEAAEARYVAELVETATPEQAYNRHWAMTLIEQALSALRAEYASAGKTGLFEALEEFLWGQEVYGSYPELAERLGMKEGAVRVAVHRLRERYREQLRQVVAQTVSDPGETEEELRYLITVVS